MNRKLTSLAVFLMVVSTTFAQTGDRSSIRGIGMGRTVNGATRGIDALGINPANLSFPDRMFGAFAVVPFGLQVSSDLIPYEIYQDYFTGVPLADGSRGARHLTEADKHHIIDELNSGWGMTRVDLEIMVVGLSVAVGKSAGVGISVKEHVGSAIVMPSDYFRFFFFGLDSAGSRYSFDGTNASAWWWREYGISFGMELPTPHPLLERFYGGIGVKIVHGFGVAVTDRYSATLANEAVGSNQYQANLSFDYLMRRSGVDFLDERKQADISPFPNPAGAGIGLDFGIAAELRGIAIHLAFTNLGSIRWKHNVVESYGEYSLTVDDPFTQVHADSIESAFRGKNRVGESFSTPLPATFRLGVVAESRKTSWLRQLPGELVLAFDYTQGLNSSLGNTTSPRFSVGAEYRIIPLLPLRTGLSMGGGDKFRWAAGFGLDFSVVSLDVATENLGMILFPNDLTMLSIAAGLKIRF